MAPIRRLIVFVGILFALILAQGSRTAEATDWSNTGDIQVNRSWHQAVLMANGKVLVAGGATGILNFLFAPGARTNTAEIFDPEADTWSLTGSMNIKRYRPVMVALKSGKLLATGGQITTHGGTNWGVTELYDPDTGFWSVTGSASMNRYNAAGVVLPNGTVLVAGGEGDIRTQSAPTAVVEIYDPARGTWSAATSMTTVRDNLAVVLLQDGRVLAVGGQNSSGSLSTAEIYDPSTGLWHQTGTLAYNEGSPVATVLQDGNVLVSSGHTVELFDPTTETWRSTSPMADSRHYFTATLLETGKVLVTGGETSSAEIFDPSTETWILTSSMTAKRARHTATRLNNGTVLVAGGVEIVQIYKRSEIYKFPSPLIAPNLSVSTEFETSFQRNLSTYTGSNTDLVSAHITRNPSKGSALISGSTVTYVPNSGMSGDDSFDYNLTTIAGVSNTATASITILPAPAPPVAADQTFTMGENFSFENPYIEFSLRIGASGGAATSATIFGHVSNGSVKLKGTTVTYYPGLLFVGTTTFAFTLSNSGGTSQPATVTIHVIGKPVAQNQTVNTFLNTPITIDLTKSAGGGPAASAALIGGVTLGEATLQGTTVTFTPSPNQQGTGSFQYTLSNISGTSNTANVAITISQPPPVAFDQSVTTKINVPVSVNLAAAAQGQPTSSVIVADPDNGTLSGDPSTLVTFTPDADTIGNSTFDFYLCNYQLSSVCAPSNTATATVNILPLLAAMTTASNGTNPASDLTLSTSVSPSATDAGNFADIPSGPVAASLVPLFGTATTGGHNSHGTVFQLTPPAAGKSGWKVSLLYAFAGGTDGSVPVGGLVRDAHGKLYGTTSGGGSASSDGTVFMLSPPALASLPWKETVLFRFRGANGATPAAGLVIGKSGELYGTTSAGGAANLGTVFRLALAKDGVTWEQTILTSFKGKADGSQPLARLTMDKAGNLYGTTSLGGSAGKGTVFKLAPTSNPAIWTETVLHHFTGGTDGANPQAPLALDIAGNLYGTTRLGGKSTGSGSNDGVVFRVVHTKTGYTESVLHAFGGGTKDGAHPQAGVVLLSTGTLAGTTYDGGARKSGTLFRLAPNAARTVWTESLIYSFQGGDDGANPSAGIVVDPRGKLVSSTYHGGGEDLGSVFTLKP